MVEYNSMTLWVALREISYCVVLGIQQPRREKYIETASYKEVTLHLRFKSLSWVETANENGLQPRLLSKTFMVTLMLGLKHSFRSWNLQERAC